MAASLLKLTLALAVLALIVLSGWERTRAHHAVLRFNLEEMESTADRIFLGRCIAAEEREEVIAGGKMPITYYTFEVERALKGKMPKRLTFSQLGHRARTNPKEAAITMHGRAISEKEVIHGMGEYKIGERLVLFLIPDYLGGRVTYPVGLDQGAFFVAEMPSGSDLVRNNINNQGLFTAPYNNWRMKSGDARVVFPERNEPLDGSASEKTGNEVLTQSVQESIETLTTKRGALPLNDFLNVVETIVTAHGNAKGVITQ
jgi:hypothetical protein